MTSAVARCPDCDWYLDGDEPCQACRAEREAKIWTTIARASAGSRTGRITAASRPRREPWWVYAARWTCVLFFIGFWVWLAWVLL